MDMGYGDVGNSEPLDVGNETLEFTPASVGNPHAVVRREPGARPCSGSARSSRTTSGSPTARTCELVRVDGPTDITVGVWERGAGEPSRASGTSAVATAGVAVARGWCESPVTVHLAGDLLVELDDSMQARLTGPAQEIFIGEASEAQTVRFAERSTQFRRTHSPSSMRLMESKRRQGIDVISLAIEKRSRLADTTGDRRGRRGGTQEPLHSSVPDEPRHGRGRGRPPRPSTVTASASSSTLEARSCRRLAARKRSGTSRWRVSTRARWR